MHGPWELFPVYENHAEDEPAWPPGTSSLPGKLRERLLSRIGRIRLQPRGPAVWSMRGGGASGMRPCPVSVV